MGKWTDNILSAGVTVRQGVSGSELTAFGSGGRVEWLLAPSDVAGLMLATRELRSAGVPYRVIGGGSDILLSDEGYEGALISLSRMSGIAFAGDLVTADAGAKMPVLAHKAADKSLAGLEFMSGIPGTVGGAVCTNAGAFGRSISDALVAVVLLSERGEIDTLTTRELAMSYHRAAIPQGSIVVSCLLRLQRADGDVIHRRMHEMAARRNRTQPRLRSAGSVFRRVGDTPAALYIERTGLKGYRVGGAELSRVHCNFIVNTGGATTADYYAVAERVRESVKKQSGVTLEYEVERICSPRSN